MYAWISNKMAAQRTIIILFLLCIQFYISDQRNVLQPADILGDDSPENKRHNEIDQVPK